MSLMEKGLSAADLAARRDRIRSAARGWHRRSSLRRKRGGSAVSIYTENEYESKDLDFVTTAVIKRIEPVMTALGFSKGSGRHFEHPDSAFVVEFPAGPLMVGNESITKWNSLAVGQRKLEVITPTQSIKDRLAAFFHWNDRQCLDQAVMIARRHRVDLNGIERWAEGENHSAKFTEFRKALKRSRQK